MHRLGFSPQVPVRRVAERDEEAVKMWKEATWAEVKGPGRPSVATRRAVHTWSSTQPCTAGPSSRYAASFSRQRGDRRHRDPLGPRDTRASIPPSRHSWCHW
ncbi:winged helix-turn-helix domain-containing protein [Streptomyces canus]|uniref:winged helix-turn-helix domain-containing protein n=1 Tax=Streptomyces canus TaxID=58343 RepID=UPI0036ECA2AF